MHNRISVWYDPEGDFLDVVFDQKPGYFIDTEIDQVMVKVDDEGHVLGFQILGVTTLKGKPFTIPLPTS